MIDSDTKYPKIINSFPNRGLHISEINKLREIDGVQRLYVPRYASKDKIPYDAQQVWELDVGIIPIIGITQFIVGKNNKIALVEYDKETWKINEPHLKKSVGFPYVLKPYISIRRSIALKEEKIIREKTSNEYD